MQMFQDEGTHQAMSSIGHLCSTIQGSAPLSLKKQAVVLLPRWTNNHYPVPGLNVVINLNKLALLPPLYRKGILVTLTIGCSDNRLSGHSSKCAIRQALSLWVHQHGMISPLSCVPC